MVWFFIDSNGDQKAWAGESPGEPYRPNKLAFINQFIHAVNDRIELHNTILLIQSRSSAPAYIDPIEYVTAGTKFTSIGTYNEIWLAIRSLADSGLFVQDDGNPDMSTAVQTRLNIEAGIGQTIPTYEASSFFVQHQIDQNVFLNMKKAISMLKYVRGDFGGPFTETSYRVWLDSEGLTPTIEGRLVVDPFADSYSEIADTYRQTNAFNYLGFGYWVEFQKQRFYAMRKSGIRLAWPYGDEESEYRWALYFTESGSSPFYDHEGKGWTAGQSTRIAQGQDTGQPYHDYGLTLTSLSTPPRDVVGRIQGTFSIILTKDFQQP